MTGARRRKWPVIFIAVAFGVALVGSWGIARLSVSPDQRAAAAKPPTALPVTVEAETRELRESVVARADIVAETTIEVRPEQGSGRLVATDLPVKDGQTIDAGRVAIVVNDRPVIALRSDTDTYRDLRRGDTGADVERLQSALRDAGFRCDDPRGTFGTSTQQAIARLWRARGFEPPRLAATEKPDDASTPTTIASLTPSSIAAPPAPAGGLENEVEGSTTTTTVTPATTTSLPAAPVPNPDDNIFLPRAEVVFVPSFPATVIGVRAKRGRPLDTTEAAMSIASGKVTSRVQLQPTEVALVHNGQRATLSDPGLGLESSGVVESIEEAAGAQGTSMVATIETESPLGVELIGRNVKAEILTSSSQGDVLAVPVGAVRTGPDGRTTVKVLRGGKASTTKVVIGLIAGGWAELKDSNVQPGDRIVVS